ncbi:UNVERIFIED_CONTAM: hypothetical protein GTU68_019572 [Idotea baltica]|nr:hypothetical protein [Idotea baltica]
MSNKNIYTPSQKAGLPPGTLLYVGENRTGSSSIDIFDYAGETVLSKENVDLAELPTYKSNNTSTWINVDGIHEIDLISGICEQFKIHPLTQEDIVNTFQRPKFEVHDEYLYVVMKMIYYDKETEFITVEQVSFILGEGYVITFQEMTEDVFGPIRDRLQQGHTRIRRRGSDYLFYALIDVIISNYFVVLERFEDHIESLEEKINLDASSDLLKEIQVNKKELLSLRRSIFPVREVINGMSRSESLLISKRTQVFIRDLYDQVYQVSDTIENFRDSLSGLHDLHLSLVSHKMNEIMKVLTIIATIFIPLTFVAGIYGMNFNNMPELQWKYGYFMAWIVMILMTIGMVLFFRKKRWL